MNFPNVEEIILQKCQVAVQDVLSRDRLYFMRNHAELTTHLDHLAGHLAVQLRSAVLGRKLGRVDVERQWPADWWQAVRERWLPAWWLRRWPVRYQRVSVHQDCWTVCPHLNVHSEEPHLRYLMLDPEPDVRPMDS